MCRKFIGLERWRTLVRPLGGRNSKVEIEVVAVAGNPIEIPAHPLAEGEQLLKGRAGDADHRHVPGCEMRKNPAEAVRRRRAGRTARGVAGAKHEVVDDELRTSLRKIS